MSKCGCENKSKKKEEKNMILVAAAMVLKKLLPIINGENSGKLILQNL